tara:strand:+ start:506 stop:952 length:447 start_codon:yes stop_codon:yes gene_type:complete
MMTGLLLFLGLVYASDPIERPAAPDPVKEECLKVLPINKSKPLPPSLFDTNGIAKCSAVAVPLSQFSDLLQTERWGVAIQSQYRIETSKLEMERDWYKEQLNDALKPKPWLERPGTQRWLGRIETIVIVGIVTAGLGATYHYTSGAGK